MIQQLLCTVAGRCSVPGLIYACIDALPTWDAGMQLPRRFVRVWNMLTMILPSSNSCQKPARMQFCLYELRRSVAVHSREGYWRSYHCDLEISVGLRRWQAAVAVAESHQLSVCGGCTQCQLEDPVGTFETCSGCTMCCCTAAPAAAAAAEEAAVRQMLPLLLLCPSISV